MHAMPLMIGILCCLAIAYRYYSAFIAAKVVALSDSAATPAERLNDGQNYHPTNKWVLFGHHFAAIAGPGPLAGRARSATSISSWPPLVRARMSSRDRLSPTACSSIASGALPELLSG